MTGIKSTSVVFKDNEKAVEPYALFCGEDDRFGTHLEVYPRASGEVYLCGFGGATISQIWQTWIGGLPLRDWRCHIGKKPCLPYLEDAIFGSVLSAGRRLTVGSGPPRINGHLL